MLDAGHFAAGHRLLDVATGTGHVSVAPLKAMLLAERQTHRAETREQRC
jgi:hypothetical protein